MSAYDAALAHEANFQQRTRELEQAVVCPECGSTYFSEVTFKEYSDMAYSGGTGGDLREISLMPQTIRVCICGYPYAPNLSGSRGRVATEEMTKFKKSLELAHQFRKQLANAREFSIDKIAAGFAAVGDIEQLKQVIAGLNSRLSDAERKLDTHEASLSAAVTETETATADEPPTTTTPAPKGKGGRGKATN